MLVRWSNAGGNADVPDTKPDIRGMAVKFQLPDGTATDLLGQTSPRFPTDDPEEFVAMTEASRHQATFPLVPAARTRRWPAAIVAGIKGKAVGRRTHSFAETGVLPDPRLRLAGRRRRPHLGALHLPADRHQGGPAGGDVRRARTGSPRRWRPGWREGR